MMRYLTQNKLVMSRGFSLVEMLIYMAIFTIVSVASVTLLLSLDEYIAQYRLETVLYRAGTNSMEQILLSIRQADRIDPINTIEDSPSTGRLVVENDVDVTDIHFTGNALELTINGDDLGDMTGDEVVVEDFTVYAYPIGTTGEFVRVRLTIRASVSGVSKSLTLYGGAVVRGAI